MTSPAALSGFVLLILLRHVVQSQSGRGATCSPDKVCAVVGATVELTCTYTYPYTGYRVIKSFWFIREHDGEPFDLKDDPQFANRVSYSDGNHGVRITNVRKSDSAVYIFRFVTDQHGGEYTGEGGVNLSVTDLQVRASGRSNWVPLTCVSSCPAPHPASYIWYKDGQKIPAATTKSHTDDYDHSYSCAFKGFESFPSAPVCGRKSECNTVTYADRSICAPLGSSVDISCTHNSTSFVLERFWFSPECSDHWNRSEHPEDLSKDSQYAGRVQVSDDQRGRCTLKITNLTQNDSAEYRFKFRTTNRGWGNDLHGTTLTVTDLQVQVKRINVSQNSSEVKLKCLCSCCEAQRLSYIWFKNSERISEADKSTYQSSFSHEDEISCALHGHEGFPSPSVHAPKTPSVQLNTSAVILNSSVTLTCSSDANPAANFTWFKKTERGHFQHFSNEEQLIFSSVKLSDAGEYRCSAENEFSQKTSEPVTIDVKYAPKPPSVSLSPESGKVTEGRSVTLNCSTDANPPATYTWYKMNQTAPRRHQGLYHFNNISSEDSGTYYCTSKNDYGQINSSAVFINVQYSPRRPIVSQNPSVKIMEGSRVDLNCSSDANPAANYTWYKRDNRDTSVASGQTFTIRDIKADHSGSYYCQAHNSIGHSNSTLCSVVVLASMKSVAVGSVTAVVLVLIVLLIIFLYVSTKRSSKETNTPRERADIQRQVINENPSDSAQRQPAAEQDLIYASVRFSKNQDDPIYSNPVKAKSKRPKMKEEDDDDDVEYSVVNFKRGGGTSQSRYQVALEDASALYSTVVRKPRV